MFYERELLAQKKAIFAVVWKCACKRGHIDKRELMSQDVSKLCDSIISMIPNAAERSTKGKKLLSLYLIAQLLIGTVHIHNKQLDYLIKDVEALKEKIMTDNVFSKLFKEIEEREKQRTEVANGENIDPLFDMNYLNENIMAMGDTANLEDITLNENLILNMGIPDYLVEDLIPSTDVLENKSEQVFSTFIDHSGEKEGECLLNSESIGNIDVEVKKRAEIEREKRENTPIYKKPIEEPMEILEKEDLQPTAEQLEQPPQEPVVQLEQQPQEPVEQLEQPPQEPVEEPTFMNPVNEPPFIDESLHNMNMTEQQTQIENLMDSGIEKEIERGRASSVRSRPVTPAELDVMTNSSKRMKWDENISLDSEVIEERPPSARKRPLRHQKNIQLSEKQMKAQSSDYSSIVKKMEDVMLKEKDFQALSMEELFDPSPFYIRNKRFPQHLRFMYQAGVYVGNVGTSVCSESSEESRICTLDEDKNLDGGAFMRSYLFPPPYYFVPQNNEEATIRVEEITEPFNMTEQLEQMVHQEPPIVIEPENIFENVRRRGKSSFGVLSDLNGREEKLGERERSPSVGREDVEEFYFRLDSLVNIQRKIEIELIKEINRSLPDAFNFTEYALDGNRMRAARLFGALLATISKQSLIVKQDGCYKDIIVTKNEEEMSTLSLGQSP